MGNKLLWLVIGGSLGTLARYGIGAWLRQSLGVSVPYVTLSVNLLGCFLIGFLGGWMETTALFSTTLQLLLMTGFLGAFTTFSAYEYESFLLLREGAMGKVLINLLGSTFLGLVMVWVGYKLVTTRV